MGSQEDRGVSAARGVTERKRPEAAVRESEARAAADLEAMTKLRDVGALFAREGNLDSVLGEIVDAAIAICGSDFGNIQLLNGETGDLEIVAHRGFPQWWLDFWSTVQRGAGACGTALERGERVVIEDVERSPIFAGTPRLEVQLKAGVRAVQSTPLVGRSGRPLGMFSTHWRTPGRPDERVLRLLDLLAQQAADIIEHARAEQALRESEEKYRSLFDSIDEGYVIGEVIFDENGQPLDGRFLEANPAAVRMARTELVGKTIFQVNPRFERHWVDTWARVSSTGLAERHEYAAEPMGTTYDFYIFKIGKPEERRIATIYHDVTERKHAEIALRESEERQAFLLKLTDALRPLSDPAEVQSTAMRLLAERLRVMRASYFEIEEDGDTFHLAATFERDATPMPERMRLMDFSPALAGAYRSGRTLAVSDTSVKGEFVEDPQAYAAIGVGAWAAVPLMRNGRLAAWIGVHSSSKRAWTAADLQALDDVAERTWGAAERARTEAALRDKELQHRAHLEQEVQNRTSELHLRIAERDALLKEVHHRVKNNLHVITSMLEMQARSTDDFASFRQLEEARNRVMSIATIHELLYQSGSFARVDLAAYAGRLVPELVALYNVQDRINLAVQGDRVTVDLERAVPCGLLLNELVSNTCKHAFPEGRRGQLTVALSQVEHRIQLSVRDTGIGLPPTFDLTRSDTLGLTIVQLLADQLGGSVTVRNGGGTWVEVEFPGQK